MQVYVCSICGLTPELLGKFLEALPPARRARAEACRTARDRAACAVGYHLARYAASRILPSPPQGDFGTDVNGKPFWKDSPVHFSLSHSGECVAVAIGKTQPVGVDIEKIRPLRRSFAARWLTTSEQAALDTAADRDTALILLWTAKEAAAKKSGAGLAYRPQNINTADTASLLLSEGGERYALSVSPAATADLVRVDVKSLIR